MRILIIPVFILFFGWAFTACKSSKPPVFCDTTCSNDSIKFAYTHPDNPVVHISVRNCQPDTIVWSHDQLATNRKMGFLELVGKYVKLNKNYVKAFFKDTAYAWLQFNDCISGRGFLVKLPFSKDDKWSIYTSALNNLDPKFNVEDGLIAYFDHSFIYVQDWKTGKVEQMKLNDTRLEIDYDNVHDTFDSVHITRSKIWADVLINNEKKVKEKSISL